MLTKFDEMPAPGRARHLRNGAVGHLVLVIVYQRHPGGPIGEIFLVISSYSETEGEGEHLPVPGDRISGLCPSSLSTETPSAVRKFPSPPLSSSQHLSSSASSAHHCPPPRSHQVRESEVIERCRCRPLRL